MRICLLTIMNRKNRNVAAGCQENRTRCVYCHCCRTYSFAFANRDKLTWENISNWWTYDVLGNAGHGYPVDIIGSEVSSGNFAVPQGHAVYASDTSFVTLTNSGTEVARLQLTHSNPVMKTMKTDFSHTESAVQAMR